MGQLPVLAGIGRQDQREAAIFGGGLGQPVRLYDAGGDSLNPVLIGAVHEARELQVRVAFGGGFEAGDPGKEAAIHLGQDDMHGEI